MGKIFQQQFMTVNLKILGLCELCGIRCTFSGTKTLAPYRNLCVNRTDNDILFQGSRKVTPGGGRENPAFIPEADYDNHGGKNERVVANSKSGNDYVYF